MLLELKQHFLPRTTDFDENNELKAEAYLDMFQTAAGRHTDMLKVGVWDLLKQNIAWILAKSRLTVYKSPTPGLQSDVIVTTVPHPKGSMDYYRDYFMHSPDGELYAKGSGQWLLLNIETRRIVRPYFDYEGKFSDMRAYDPVRIEKVDACDSEPIYSHTVTRNDIDFNGHTNNIKYAAMLYNALALPKGKAIFDSVINYTRETYLGDEIRICRKIADADTHYFSGYSAGNAAFTAKVILRPRG